MCIVLSIVPTLRVVTPSRTLCVQQTTRVQPRVNDAERHGMHHHAERGDDHKSRSEASRLKPVALTARIAFSGTGFSREEARSGADIRSFPRSAW